MNIQKIVVDSFGKLQNFTLNLEKGFNLIYGPNEAGKSTICAFLYGMFYSFPTKRADLRDNPRKRYLPWDGSPMAGSVYFSHDGKEYVLERKIGTTKRADRVSLRDGATWEEIKDIDTDTIGKEFLGVGPDGFLKTLYMGQLAAGIQKGKEDEINARLANLNQSGDEDVSYQKVLTQLESVKYEIISRNDNGGTLRLLEKQTEDLKQRLAGVMDKNAEYREDMQREAELRVKIIELEKEIQEIAAQKGKAKEYEQFLQRRKLEEGLTAKTKKLEEVRKQAEEVTLQIQELAERREKLTHLKDLDQNIGLTLTEKEARITSIQEKLTLAEELKKQIQTLQEQRQETLALAQSTNYNPFLWVGILILALSFLGGFLVFPALYGLCVVGIIFLLLAFRGKKGAQKEAAKAQTLQIQIEERESRLNKEEEEALHLELAQSKEWMASILKQGKASTPSQLMESIGCYQSLLNALAPLEKEKGIYAAQIEGLEQELEGLRKQLPRHDQEEVADIGITADQADEQLEQARMTLLEQEKAYKEVEYWIANRLEGVEEVDLLETQIQINTEKQKELQEQYDAVCTAISVLQDSYQALKNDFAPLLGSKVREILTSLTDGKYTDVKVSDTYEMALKDSAVAEIISAEYVSGGTYDLIYVALRLGILKVLYENEVPLLILDDTFLQLDEERNHRASQYLLGEENLSQILYFTCHKSQVQRFQDIRQDLHIIHLT